MKSYNGAILALLFLLVLGIAVPHPSTGQVGDTVAEAQELFEEGNRSEARTLFESALEREPDEERSLYFLGQIHRIRGETSQALEYFRRFVDRSPGEFRYFNPVDAYLTVGEYMTRRDLYEEALKVLGQAEGLNKTPEQEETFEEWYQRAREGYERIVGEQLRREFEASADEVHELADRQQTEAALDLLLEQEDEFGELVEFRDLRRQLEQRIEFDAWRREVLSADRDVSAERLEELIEPGELYLEHQSPELREEARPPLGHLYSLQGVKAFDEGRMDEARSWFERAEEYEISPHPDRLHAMASLAYDDGEIMESLGYLERLEQVAPGYDVDTALSWLIWFRTTGLNLLWILLLVGLLGVAGYFLRPFVNRGLTTTKGQELGTYLLAKEYPRLAATVFGWFCRVEDMKQHHVMNWQQALRRTDQVEELGRVLEEAHRQTLLPPDGIVDYAWYKREHEGDEAARPLLEDALEHWDELKPSRRARLAKVLSSLLVDQGENERAFEVLLRLQEDQDPDSPLVKKLTDMASDLGRWETWERLGKAWLDEVKGSYIQADYQIGYSEEQQDDGALDDPGSIAKFLHELYQNSRDVPLEEEPDSRVEFLLELVETYQKDKTPVRELLSVLVKRPLPENKLLKYGQRLADLFRQQKQVEQAMNLYKQLHQRFPNDRKLKEKLGGVYLDLDRRDEALKLFKELLKGQSDHISARQGIHRIGERYENEEDYKTAEDCYRYILDNSHVKKPNTLFRLAMSTYRQGKVEQALNQLQEIDQGDKDFQSKVNAFTLRCMVELEMYDTAVSRAEDLDLDSMSIKPQVRRTLRYWAARAYEGDEQRDTALKLYQKIAASDVDYADVKQRIERLKARRGVQKGD